MTAWIGICLLVACVVAGCTSDQPNDGESTSPTPTVEMPEISMPQLTPLPPSPPPITRPLDASGYATEATVCDLFTDTQATELGLPNSGDPNSSSGGSLLTCGRNGFDTKRSVEYNLWPDSDSLGSAFGSRPRGSEDVYLVDIDGQPAVVEGKDPAPACLVVVGLAARQGVEVLADDDGDNSCALALAVAAQMIRNLAG